MLTIGNEGDSWYRALQVVATPAVGPLHAMTSYTLSRADDRANYLLPEDSRALAAERGRAATDVRHNLAAAAVFRVPGTRAWTRGWTVSATGAFRSNRPYTISWGDDRNGTTQNDARPGPRNTGRTGPYRAIDGSLSRRFDAGSRSTRGSTSSTCSTPSTTISTWGSCCRRSTAGRSARSPRGARRSAWR
jgi:hypothetical protein